MNKLTDAEIVKALEDYLLECKKVKYGARKKVIVDSDFLQEVLDHINRLRKENDDLFLKLEGVMWSVDKWLDGKELEQDEVNRAVTMREKTLRIVEKLQKENKRLLQKLQHPVVAENAITALREKCIEHQDFHKGDDGVFRGWISIEDLDEIIYELFSNE